MTHYFLIKNCANFSDNCSSMIFINFYKSLLIKKFSVFFQVTKDDELPKSICATCFIKIESIDKFAYLAAKSEETFIAYLMRTKDKFTKSSPVTTITHQDENSVDNMQQLAYNGQPQQQKMILKTYRNPRNPRHVDHITLEQIINDQIVKNPKGTQVAPTIVMTRPLDSSSIIAYHDLKIGQLIKDEELLKLILKALKWVETSGNNKRGDHWLKKLKQSKFRDILSNPNLLNDSDLMQLIKSYVGQDALTLFNTPYNIPTKHFQIIPTTTTTNYIYSNESMLNHLNDQENVTQMEVGVDPSLFIDDETRNSTPIDKKATEQDTEIRNNGKFFCSMCPETFTLNNELQNHVLTHLLEQKTEKKTGSRQKRGRKQHEKEPSLDVVVTKTHKICPHMTEYVERRGRKPKQDNQDASLACPYCRKLLSTKGNLKVHINVHKRRGEKEIGTCQKCLDESQVVIEKETDKIPLKDTFKDVTSEPPKIPQLTQERIKTSKKPAVINEKEKIVRQKFSCESCNRIFGSKGALSIHLLSHALEKTKKKKLKGKRLQKKVIL